MLHYRRASNYREQGYGLAEFAPALIVIIIVLFFVISVLSGVCGYGALVYGCQLASREAASAPNLMTARQHTLRIRDSVIRGPFGKFGGVREATNGEGLSLEVVRLVDGQNAAQPWSPGQNIDTSSSYQYRVRGNFLIRPLFWPVSVPAQMESTAVVEHPEGLSIIN